MNIMKVFIILLCLEYKKMRLGVFHINKQSRIYIHKQKVTISSLYFSTSAQTQNQHKMIKLKGMVCRQSF